MTNAAGTIATGDRINPHKSNRLALVIHPTRGGSQPFGLHGFTEFRPHLFQTDPDQNGRACRRWQAVPQITNNGGFPSRPPHCYLTFNPTRPDDIIWDIPEPLNQYRI